MTISIIVAVAENNAIGYDNHLLWHISEDLKRFKNLTIGHHIIMGRKTYESVGKPLPGRINIVISRQESYSVEGGLIAKSLEEALELAKQDSEVFIIGGAEIYKQALPITDKIYLTRVHAGLVGDAFFPELNLSEWSTESIQRGKPANDDGLGYSFINLVRNRKS
ncbi:MAG: dihydrofolate reductase [Bacteroidales bacterium]|nr:MAG: dihydrofolate reductase [Bacteroidales bacterium]